MSAPYRRPQKFLESDEDYHDYLVEREEMIREEVRRSAREEEELRKQHYDSDSSYTPYPSRPQKLDGVTFLGEVFKSLIISAIIGFMLYVFTWLFGNFIFKILYGYEEGERISWIANKIVGGIAFFISTIYFIREGYYSSLK